MIKQQRAYSFFITHILLFLVMVAPAFAVEVRYPIPCYEGEELKKVRQWEKIWVGKIIDTANVDKIKELLPESLYEIITNEEEWGRSWFAIVPYRQYTMTAGTIAATKKYSPAARLGEQGELLDWVAGVPFPVPKTGMEIAWNYYARTKGDSLFTNAPAYIVDGRKKYDRNVQFEVWLTYFAGRLDVPPVPEILPNPKQIYRGASSEFTDPPEMRGNLSFQATYKDTSKPYDMWAWFAGLRRVRRMSTAQRTDTQAGQDLCYDDNYGWDGSMIRNTYEILGRKEILVARHQDIQKLEHTEGDCIVDGLQRERINTFVLEVINKDPGYIYKKSIWYMDPELWHIAYADRYDKHGNYWKQFDQYQAIFKGYKDQDIPYQAGSMTIDHQRIHSTFGIVPDSKLGIEIPTEKFSIKYLYKYGR